MKRDKLPVREMIKGERSVVFIGKALQILEYVLQTSIEEQLHKARILFARSGMKLIIG